MTCPTQREFFTVEVIKTPSDPIEDYNKIYQLIKSIKRSTDFNDKVIDKLMKKYTNLCVDENLQLTEKNKNILAKLKKVFDEVKPIYYLDDVKDIEFNNIFDLYEESERLIPKGQDIIISDLTSIKDQIYFKIFKDKINVNVLNSIRKITNYNILKPYLKNKPECSFSDKDKLRFFMRESKRKLVLDYILTSILIFGLLSSINSLIDFQFGIWFILINHIFYFIVVLGFFIDVFLLRKWYDNLNFEENPCMINYLIMKQFMKRDSNGFAKVLINNNPELHIEYIDNFDESGTYITQDRFSYGANNFHNNYENYGYKLWFQNMNSKNHNGGIISDFCVTRWYNCEFDCYQFKYINNSGFCNNIVFTHCVKTLIDANFETIKKRTTSVHKHNKIQSMYVNICKFEGLHHPNLHNSKVFHNFFEKEFKPFYISAKLKMNEDEKFYSVFEKVETEIVEVEEKKGYEFQDVTNEFYETKPLKHAWEDYEDYFREEDYYYFKQLQGMKVKDAKRLERDIRKSIEYYDEVDPNWKTNKSLVVKKVETKREIVPKIQKVLITKPKIYKDENQLEHYNKKTIFKEIEIDNDMELAEARRIKEEAKRVLTQENEMNSFIDEAKLNKLKRLYNYHNNINKQISKQKKKNKEYKKHRESEKIKIFDTNLILNNAKKMKNILDDIQKDINLVYLNKYQGNLGSFKDFNRCKALLIMYKKSWRKPTLIEDDKLMYERNIKSSKKFKHFIHNKLIKSLTDGFD